MDGRRQYPDGDGQFVNAPYFNFNDGDLKFNTNWVDNPNDNYGSASGFLSKSLLIAPIVSSRQASCRSRQ
jgi:hypothetical protein